MMINKVLGIVLFILIIAIIVLALIYLNMMLKQKNSKEKKKPKSQGTKATGEIKQTYNIKSIFDFMEFEKIEDNMIVQKKGKKFLMAIECQGINYDLMSEIEQNSVESGFMQFLNTLREPIQIYIQSRTVNLEHSIQKYKLKIKKLEEDLNQKESKYKMMLNVLDTPKKQLDMQKLEVARTKNLYEYGKDIIANTERMSLNKNILRKKYYIILSYYYSGNNDEEYYDTTEIKDMAFSELYTKAQTLIRSLASTGVVGHVANSYELVDLLYNAYNKDEADSFGIDKALLGGFDELYITSQDVYEKRVQLLDKKIEKEAIELAENAAMRAKSKMEKRAEDREDNLESLISDLAKELLDENEQFLGEEMLEISKESVDEIQEEKEEKENVKKERRTRKTK